MTDENDFFELIQEYYKLNSLYSVTGTGKDKLDAIVTTINGLEF